MAERDAMDMVAADAGRGCDLLDDRMRHAEVAILRPMEGHVLAQLHRNP